MAIIPWWRSCDRPQQLDFDLDFRKKHAMADLDKTYDEAVVLKDSGDLEGAVAKLNEILAEDDNHQLAHSALAVYLNRLGKNDDAMKHANRVAEIAPDDAFSFTQLSVIYQRCGKIQEAEDAMERARQIQAAG